MRVLVTGSRDWEDKLSLEAVLDYAHDQFGDFELIQGECYKGGADLLAKQWAQAAGLEVIGVPADWGASCPRCPGHRRYRNGESYCPAQGHLRNQAMVDMKPDLCIGFPLPDSRGTKDCMKRAERAGIPVWDFGVS